MTSMSEIFWFYKRLSHFTLYVEHSLYMKPKKYKKLTKQVTLDAREQEGKHRVLSGICTTSESLIRFFEYLQRRLLEEIRRDV